MNNLLKYALAGSISLGSFALIISAPWTAKNLKPLKNERMQESELFSVFTDKETGDMYGYIDGPRGETRFVKMDKNSENKVRQEKINEERALARQEALAREQQGWKFVYDYDHAFAGMTDPRLGFWYI